MAQQDRTEFERRDPTEEDLIGRADDDDVEDVEDDQEDEGESDEDY